MIRTSDPAQARSFYVTGGTVPRDSPSYVVRKADAELVDGLRRGQFCYVLTSRQMGKSSLMVRAAHILRREGAACVLLDLTSVGQSLTREQWYRGLLEQVGDALGLEDALDRFWRTQAQFGPLQRFLGAIRSVVLGVESRGGVSPPASTETLDARLTPHVSRLIIFVDEIDAVRSLPFSADEFFAGIRACYNRRTEDPVFQRLTFCLLGVATPADLIRDTRTTPFNIGRRIDLTDFTPDEAAPLARGLLNRSECREMRGSRQGALPKAASTSQRDAESRRETGEDERTAERLLSRILYWTRGHPYLTQKLCQAVAECRSTSDAGEASSAPTLPAFPPTPHASRLTADVVDRICADLFLAQGARAREDNLLFVRDCMLRSEGDKGNLLHLYGRVRAGRRIKDDETNPLVSLLHLSGLVRVERTYLAVRNRIYARVFDRAWIEANMPDAELRRRKAAYRQGLARAASLSLVVIAMLGGLLWRTVRSERRVRDLLNQTREQRDYANHLLYIAGMREAQQAWDARPIQIGRIREILEETRAYPDRGFEWGYWNRLCHLDLRTFTGHTRYVTSVAITPDGRQIVSGSDDHTARIWDAATGRTLCTLAGHAGAVTSVAFFPDGKRVVTGSADGTAKIWEAATGRESRTLRGHTGAVYAVAVSGNGRRVVTGGKDRTARVWDAKTGSELRTLAGGHSRLISSVAVSADGKRVVTGSYDKTAKVWDTETRCILRTLKGHTDKVYAVAISTDSRRVVTGSADRAARMWDALTGKALLTLQGHRQTVTAVAISADGRRIVTGGFDNMATFWAAATGWELLTLQGHTRAVYAVALSSDSRFIVTGSDDRTVKIWSASSEPTVILKGHTARVTAVAYAPDGRRIVTGSNDGTARVWDAATGREMLALKGHTGTVTSVTLSGDGRRIVTCSDDCTVRVWNPVTGLCLGVLKGHTAPIKSVAISVDGARVATGGNDGTVRVWDALTKRKLLIVRARLNTITSVAMSPDGRRLVTGGLDNTAILWDVLTRRKLLSLEGLVLGVSCVAISADGKRILTDDSDNVVTAWDVSTRRKLLTLRGHTGPVSSVAVSPDGRRIITGSWDGTAKVWDVSLGRELLTLKGQYADGPTPIAISPDGQHAVVSNEGNTARVWEAAFSE